MDYKSKYIKYKMKYQNLLGGLHKRFGVKRNNGSDDSGRYSNQCLWLSIIDYLNGVLGNNYNLDDIRYIGSRNDTRINNSSQQFDTDYHLRSLINVCETFDLQIHFYVAFRDKSTNLVISNEPNWIVGNYHASNVVSIVSYGAHFELITYIDDMQLYKGKISVNKNFIPNRELALGINKNLVKKLNFSQIEKIDELLEITVNFERIIYDLEKDLNTDQTRLINLENSFIINAKNIYLDSEEAQVAMIATFQEHKIFLEKVINEKKTELEEMKRDLETYEKELEHLLNH